MILEVLVEVGMNIVDLTIYLDVDIYNLYTQLILRSMSYKYKPHSYLCDLSQRYVTANV